MADLNQYRQFVREILTELHGYNQGNPHQGVDSQIILDSDHYLLLDVGWQEKKYVYAVFVHLDIKDGKMPIRSARLKKKCWELSRINSRQLPVLDYSKLDYRPSLDEDRCYV